MGFEQPKKGKSVLIVTCVDALATRWSPCVSVPTQPHTAFAPLRKRSAGTKVR